MSVSSPLRVTVLYFHPFTRRSQTNRLLWDAVQAIPGVETYDLYERYPEFSIDVEAEQAILLRSDVIVFQHPFYWYNCPSLMKEWLDSVLERGWAYGPGGDKLSGKYWVQSITTGGGEDAYHRTGYNVFSIPELLRPFEQSAVSCGMKPLQPFLTQGTSQLTSAQRQAQASKYRQWITDLMQNRLPPIFSTGNTAECTSGGVSP